MQRHPHFTLEQIMVYVKIPTQELRHSRAAQELLAEGQAQGRRVEAASMTLRQLTHRCGPLMDATTSRIQALPLEQLEALGLALLDFSGADDLAAWLAQHAS